MNKVVTDGIHLMPLPFSAGLDRWSCENGKPGEATYADLLEAAVVNNDPVFGSCLRMVKDQMVTRLRYAGETPILPGCYLQITARVRVTSGPLPTVRIAGWPGRAGMGGAAEHTTKGPAVAVTNLDEVVTVKAIVATAHRTGVDLVWQDAIYGHFGIDLTGPSGATVIVDDLIIEDVSATFQGDLFAAIDVRDYGAIADATTDASAAFGAADMAAQGREVIVPPGVFFLGEDVRLASVFRFVGTIVQPWERCFVLTRGLDFSAYCRAFGDIETAFRKAFQAMSYVDAPAVLDLAGSKVALTAPLDLQGCDGGFPSSNKVKALRNGSFMPLPSPDWVTDVVKSKARYDADDAWRLCDIARCEDIAIGCRVSGKGVGREVYVRSVDAATRSLTLSQPLHGASGQQQFTFHRYKYLLDFSGFEEVSQFQLENISLECDGIASGVLLATSGRKFSLRNCLIDQPKDRGLTSAGTGCVGLTIAATQILGDESPSQRRETVGLNANGNYLRIHDSVFGHLTHFAVVAGAGASITGNEWTHGHQVERSRPQGGLILTKPMCASVITANSFLNGAVVWTSEHMAASHGKRPNIFGGLTITGNSFTTNALAHWVTFLHIAPYGPAHVLDGLSVVGNVFRSVNGRINRVETLDTKHGHLALDKLKAVSFSGNTFHGVRDPVINPANLVLEQRNVAQAWVGETQPNLPFNGLAKWVDSASLVGPLADAAGEEAMEAPRFDAQFGADGRQVQFRWTKPVSGRLRYQVRMDDPF